MLPCCHAAMLYSFNSINSHFISMLFRCFFSCFISFVKYVTAFVIANLITWILDFVTLRKEEGEYDIDINYSDYRQTINIIAAYYITDEKYICEMNACYCECWTNNKHQHSHTLVPAHSARIHSGEIFRLVRWNFFIGNNFNDNNILMYLDL